MNLENALKLTANWIYSDKGTSIDWKLNQIKKINYLEISGMEIEINKDVYNLRKGDDVIVFIELGYSRGEFINPFDGNTIDSERRIYSISIEDEYALERLNKGRDLHRNPMLAIVGSEIGVYGIFDKTKVSLKQGINLENLFESEEYISLVENKIGIDNIQIKSNEIIAGKGLLRGISVKYLDITNGNSIIREVMKEIPFVKVTTLEILNGFNFATIEHVELYEAINPSEELKFNQVCYYKIDVAEPISMNYCGRICGLGEE